MPSKETLHNRYALALFEVAKKEKKLDEIMKGLEFLSEEFLKDKKFHNILLNPLVSRKEKKDIFNEILHKFKISYPLDSFLHLLVNSRRENLLHAVFLRYRDLYQLEKQLMQVYVETAMELSPHEKHLLNEALKKRFKRAVEIEATVKPKLLGGIFIRWKDIIYNDTLHGKLEQFGEII
jgi:ATP synthase F1 delta subunit